MANGGSFSSILSKVVSNIGPIRRTVSKLTINRYAYAVPPRPRPISMAADYVTWRGLTDRRYSGRHLPVPQDDVAPKQPPMDQLLPLFDRANGGFKKANDTSLLFPFFAQWFVDSFLRTKWEDPAQTRHFRENESNHEIDLCSIYGMTELQTDMLREKKGGRLRTQVIDGQEYPMNLFAEKDGTFELAEPYADLYNQANFNRVYNDPVRPWAPEQRRYAFAVGLEHGSSTLGNSIMNTLFMREHNRVAGIIAAAHREDPVWDDERIFQTTRNVVIVELLNIVISDYIVHIAPIDITLEAVPGMAERESWYRTNWMAVEFALLYRWHDLIPDTFKVTKDGATVERPGTDLIRANKLLLDTGLDQLLLDASGQYAGKIGLGNTASFLLHVKKLSVEMARTCRLPSYNAYRKYYGLKPVKSFEALTREQNLAGKLKALYGDIDRLEWFVGLFAESYSQDSMMGELLVTMVANDAFTQALTNPLLSKAVYCEDTFSKEGLEIIQENRTLADVIIRNTGIDDRTKVGFKVC